MCVSTQPSVTSIGWSEQGGHPIRQGHPRRPDPELVGLYAFSKEKVVQDVGDLLNLDRKIGIHATDDIDALLALRPDCIVYMPLHPDVEEMTRPLRAGGNVVTTASCLTGRGYGEGARAQLEAAAQAGGVSLFGSGINPGWVDAVEAIAKMFKFELDEIRCEAEFAHATADIEPAWDIAGAYLIEVNGAPQLKLRADVLPADFTLPIEELIATGFITTAMPVVNTVASAVAARPGIVTYADLPPVTSVLRPVS